MSSKKENLDGKWKISSESKLWNDFIVDVKDGFITGCFPRGSIELGSNFASMKNYWENFEGDSKHLISKLHEQE